MTIQFDFRDKGVLVSDGTTTLGRQVAAAFHDLGARVAIHGRSAGAVQEAVRELGGGARLIAAPGELSKTAGIPSLVEGALAGLESLDVLVCLGTKSSLREVDKIDTDYFEQVMGDNVKQLFFLSQACVPALRKSRGSVVNVASSVGLV
ncbi:MAG: SDR family NAD(P)-dependent oxidoreductase, partial [Steroidobacteraceae bacterium]